VSTVLLIHPPTVEGSTTLLLLIGAAAAGTGLLFLLSVVAYLRRQTTQYLLVSLAVGALWSRSIVGTGTVLGYVGMPVHHLVVHTLDLCVALIILYAVYAHAPGSLPATTAEE
jgi:hypothetical protein